MGGIVGVGKEPKLDGRVGEAGLAVASFLVARARSIGKGVGVSVGTRVLNATGVTKMLLVAAGVGFPNRLLQPIKADSMITRDIKSAALL